MNDNIKIGSDIHAGDGGYSIGTQEKYDEFVKGRNESLGNMRIKEIALQAGGSHYPTVGGKTLEKFAELLIRECVEVAQMNTPDTEECEYTHLISEKIKEHFGVK